MCKWFKHDVLAHRDKKLRALQAKHGHNGTGIYFHLLEVMGYDDDGYLDYDLDALCIELGLVKRKDRQVLDEVIKDFGLFEFTDDGSQFYSPRFTEYLEGINNVSAPSNAMETSPAIEPSSRPKRRYTLSEKALNQRKRAQAQRNQATELTKSNNEINEIANEISNEINEIEQRNGGTIGGEKEDIRLKNKENIDSVGAKPQKRFVPPTPEEVKAYCSSKGYPDESEKFVDYHTSKGWRVGNSPMKDWKAALRYWMSNNNRYPNTSQSPRGERLIRDDSQMDKVRDARW